MLNNTIILWILLAILQISGGKSNSTHEVDKKVVLSPENWVVCFAETKNQAASLALVKPSALTETIVLEAMSYKNVNVLKMMETKLHEFLRGKYHPKQLQFLF